MPGRRRLAQKIRRVKRLGIFAETSFRTKRRATKAIVRIWQMPFASSVWPPTPV